MPWYNAVTGEHVYSPSDDDKQKDELVYRPSIYAKEELPTWAEVYEEFYLGKQYTYGESDKKEDLALDLYWNIPHIKFLIAVVCNQFNKMIYEDNLKDQIIAELNSKIDKEIVGIRFKFGTKDDIYFNIVNYSHDYKDKVFDVAPTIYTIPLPSGKSNPFITSNHTRVDVTQIKDPNRIYPVLQIKSSITVEGYAIYSPSIDNDDFNTIIEVMMKQYIDYFTGDIGWKSDDGESIECDQNCRGCTGAGYCAK